MRSEPFEAANRLSRIPEPITPSPPESSRDDDIKAIHAFDDRAVNLDGWPFRVDDHVVRPAREPSAGPDVLVVTPSFNQARFLESTIRSVLLQDYPNLRYVVVDGGSTDGSREILEHYRDAIDELIIEPDHGQSDAILKGIGSSKAGWFNWINSDDLLMPGIVRRLVEESDVDCDLWTASVGVVGDGAPYRMRNQNLSAAAMLREDRYSFSQPGLWFRLPRFWSCGGIRRDFQYGFDWDLLVRYLGDRARVQYADGVGAIFRVHQESKTNVEQQKSDNENRFEREHHAIREKLEAELSTSLADASRLGRRRRPWNAWLIDQLDDWETSPARLSARVLSRVFADVPARFSRRTAATVVRLLSRYVRPNWKRRNQ